MMNLRSPGQVKKGLYSYWMGFEIGWSNDDPGDRNVTVPGVDFGTIVTRFFCSWLSIVPVVASPIGPVLVVD